ncbi:tetraspanin-3-like [Anticarsia gemmatalis]|uniref:tetraspanin-3-like n=1 Tax=Anticarsia gemmatalis TaxID=129554 RepID=UPI003F760B8E
MEKIIDLKYRLPSVHTVSKSKRCLTAVNCVFLFTGVLLLLVGTSSWLKHSAYDQLIPSRFYNLPGFVAATGVIILLASVQGLYGGISQDFCYLAAHFFLMLVVLISEICIVIVGFALSNEAESLLKSSMSASFQQYGNSLQSVFLWDELQRGLKCCGVSSPYDWLSDHVPFSCCLVPYGSTLSFKCDLSYVYMRGCASALGEHLSHQTYLIAMCALLATCLQVIIMSLSGLMVWRSKREEVVFKS